MATGTIRFMPGAAVLPDGSASNLAPAVQRVKSSATAPGIYLLQLAFDATNEEWCTWADVCPADYGTDLTALVQYKMATAITGGVAWDVRVGATAPGDSQDVDAQNFDAANVGTDTVPGTAGFLDSVSITLSNNDGLTAGDFYVIRLARAVGNASDTATGDAEVVSLRLTYTTA